MINQAGRGGPGALHSGSSARKCWQWPGSFHLQILTVWLFAVWLTVNRSRAATLIKWSSRQKRWFPGSPSTFCSAPFPPAHDDFVGGGFPPSFYSQRHFVSYKTNFLYPSTETLDDATICGLRKYANLMLFFMLLCLQVAEMTCFIWDPAGLSQAGALNLRLMAGKLLHLSADLMLTYAQSSCLRVHPHFKLA